VKIAIIALVATQVANVALVPWFKHAGLALSVSLGASANAGMLLVGLRRRGIYEPLPGWAVFLGKADAALCALAVLLWVIPPTCPCRPGFLVRRPAAVDLDRDRCRQRALPDGALAARLQIARLHAAFRMSPPSDAFCSPRPLGERGGGEGPKRDLMQADAPLPLGRGLGVRAHMIFPPNFMSVIDTPLRRHHRAQPRLGAAGKRCSADRLVDSDSRPKSWCAPYGAGASACAGGSPPMPRC